MTQTELAERWRISEATLVEYSSTANTHPEGVRLVVLKTPPE